MSEVKFLCKDCRENVTKDELEYLTKPDPHEGHNKVWFAHPTMERPEEISPEVSVNDTATFESDVKALRSVANGLGTILFERQDAIKVSGLAILAREHALYYGEPGTGKNALIEALAECLDHSYFQYQIHQATTDAELFGPFDIAHLREKSEMRRNIKHTILDTEFAFLDEIGNSNSMIRNSLKELMQGKRFSVGGEMISTPLQCIFAASNSILEYQDPTEHAFEDRFLFRHNVLRIQDRNNLVKMFKTRDTANAKLPSIEHAVVTRLQSYVNEVVFGDAFYEMFADFLQKLEGDAPGQTKPMSDRRKMKILKAIAANAVYNGRKRAKKSDLSVLLHIVWNEPDQIVELNEWLRNNLTSGLDKAEAINSVIEQIYAGYQQQQANLEEWTDRFSNGMLSRQLIQAQQKALASQVSQVDDEDERESLNKYIKQAEAHVNTITLEMIDIKKDNGDSPDYDDLESLKKITAGLTTSPRQTQVDQVNRGSLLNRVETTNVSGQVTGVTYSEAQPTEAERQAALAKQQADREAENKRIAAEALVREQQLEEQRVKRNANLNTVWGNRFRESSEDWSTKPGTGYHFGHNFKGDDGNYYTEFKSNRGYNTKNFSISERKWLEYGLNSYCCNNGPCDGVMIGQRNFDKTCPKCGTIKAKGTSY